MVKSLRIGWQSELADCIAEVKVRNYAALCSHETHHGRGLTEAFCALENEAVAAASEKRAEISAQGKNWNIWLPPRSLNCFYTWLKLAPDDVNVRRGLDDTPWAGVPSAMADGHTYEGCRLGTRITLLSGHYHNHAALGKRVMREGRENHARITESDR